MDYSSFDYIKSTADEDLDKVSGMDSFSRKKYLDKMADKRAAMALKEVRARNNAGMSLYKLLHRWHSFKLAVKDFFRLPVTLWGELKELYNWAENRIKAERKK